SSSTPVASASLMSGLPSNLLAYAFTNLPCSSRMHAPTLNSAPCSMQHQCYFLASLLNGLLQTGVVD
ncbi:hypothetical protein A2U01_0049741, partial [Trifolium medium]|nr:hypothetical protein [Trifolium medium]